MHKVSHEVGVPISHVLRSHVEPTENGKMYSRGSTEERTRTTSMKIAHDLKKVGARFEVPIIFSAPN